MGKIEFSQSLAEGGRHHALGKLAGEWSGTTRVWFDPDTVADEAPIRGTIRSVLGGRFLHHEYTTTFMGEAQYGIAIYAFHIDRDGYEMSWIDSAHTGTQIMHSQGPAGGEGFSVLGHYGGLDGGVPWGWRTEIALDGDDRLIITSYNIEPGAAEQRAVETIYERVAAAE